MQMDSTEIRFVIGSENTVRRRLCALYSPKILRAGTVKELIFNILIFRKKKKKKKKKKNG